MKKIVLLAFVLVPLLLGMLVPSVIASEFEKIDVITTMEGSGVGLAFGPFEVPLLIKEHVHTVEEKGNNVIMRVDVEMMNMTDPDKPKKLEDFSGNSTYVVNEFTRQNVEDAPEADKPRVGYDPLYPPHLKVGEDIHNVWLDSLNVTATLEFKESIIEEGITLYKYYVNKTINKELDLPIGRRNCTLTSTKTILIEPLFGGLPAYTENETFSLILYYNDPIYGPIEIPLIKLTYRSTAESKAQGLERARAAMGMVKVFDVGTWNGVPCEVYLVSNSTVSDFQLDKTQRMISFNVTGPYGSLGFCRVTIPSIIVQDLWQGNYTGLVDGKPPLDTRNWTDGTYTYIYFTYLHSTHEVVIIPEFPTWTSLLLVLTMLTVAIAIYKGRLPKTPIH